MDATGGCNGHPLELLGRERRRAQLLTGAGCGRLHPAQAGIAANRPGQAGRRIAGEPEKHFRALEHAAPPPLGGRSPSKAGLASVVSGIADRRQQVRLVKHLDVAAAVPNQLHQLGFERCDDRDRDRALIAGAAHGRLTFPWIPVAVMAVALRRS